MKEEDIKLLLSYKSIILFLVILSTLLVIAIFSHNWSRKNINHNTYNTILLSTISITDYLRYIDKEYIEYVNQDFDKLTRNNLQCNMKENAIIILKKHNSKLCHQGVCHIEIGYFNSKGDLIKYYDSK